MQVTRAMVLAAGLGTRMRPMTDRVPKPLVKLAGRTLLDHVLDRLVEAGVTEVVVNVHYMADLIVDHVSRRGAPRITLSDERDCLLDTGGGVLRALPRFEGGPFIIHNSDSVWLERGQSNIKRMMDFWDDNVMDCLLLLAPMAASLGYYGHGDFSLTDRSLAVRRGERMNAPYVFTGVSIAHPRLFEGAPAGAFSLNKLWDKAIEGGRLHGVPLEGTWMHVGTPEAHVDAERLIAGERDSGTSGL